MQGIMKEPKQHNCEVDILSQIEEYTQCQIAGTAGELVMTRHQVFSGIELIYNDVHLGQYTPNRGDLGLVLEINYCREGRMEGEFQDEFFYLTPGDLSIRRKKDVDYHSTFPLHHYHGITIAIDIQKAPDCLSCLLMMLMYVLSHYYTNSAKTIAALLLAQIPTSSTFFQNCTPSRTALKGDILR